MTHSPVIESPIITDKLHRRGIRGDASGGDAVGKPILCLDFDGVLHAYTSGWQGATVMADGPVPGAMNFLAEAVQSFDVCIYSSRSKEDGGIVAMETALHTWLWDARHYEVLDKLSFPDQKPAAFLTIDDRAICFTGTFPKVDELLAFKPWNKE